MKTELITLSFTILRRTFGVTFWSEKPEKKEQEKAPDKAVGVEVYHDRIKALGESFSPKSDKKEETK